MFRLDQETASKNLDLTGLHQLRQTLSILRAIFVGHWGQCFLRGDVAWVRQETSSVGQGFVKMPSPKWKSHMSANALYPAPWLVTT